MFIEHNGIVIRNAEKKDCEQLAGWWNDGGVMAHAGFPLGLGITAEEIAEKLSSDSDDSGRRLMIEYNGVPAGEANYRNKGENVAEIGIKICDPSRQNKGLGRVILSLIINYLFCHGYDKIILDTNLNNKRAQHVYELLGFKKLRVNTGSWTDQLGQKQSSVDYELTKADFNDFSGGGVK